MMLAKLRKKFHSAKLLTHHFMEWNKLSPVFVTKTAMKYTSIAHISVVLPSL